MGQLFPGGDLLTGMFSLPLWLAAFVAALLVVFAIRGIHRHGASGAIGPIAGLAVLALVLAVSWIVVDQLMGRDQADARRAFLARDVALTAAVTAQGSPLACLDSNVSDAVATDCERALFATPEIAAAAVAYTAARLNLLSEGDKLAGPGNVNFTKALNDLRRTIEADRFGIGAHVLATRDGCNADQCPTFALVSDAKNLQAHLRDSTYQSTLARYIPAWKAQPPVAGLAPKGTPGAGVEPGAATAATAVPGTPSVVPPGFQVPSAESIPPVSIMNAEPGTTETPKAETAKPEAHPKPAAKPETKTAATPEAKTPPQRRPVRRAPAPAPGPPPVQITPSVQ